MSEVLHPGTLDELVDAVRSTQRLLAVGAETKPRLSSVDATKLSMEGLRGIVEYDPGEFTFTALAGTAVREIVAALAERGQYMPFDPMLLDASSTLGGVVASGLSGPGRFRFGGIRDFILGVRFVDGDGRLLRLGGKVVKNAAGFDLPKFFVGSLGRFGVLAEMTLKVFPRPSSTLTLRLDANSIEAATSILLGAAGRRWELDALEIPPGELRVALRLAGPPPALQSIASEILSQWDGQIMARDDSMALWASLGEFAWTHRDGVLAKVVLAPTQLARLHHSLRTLEDIRIHVSAGGNVAFVSLAASVFVPDLDARLRDLGLSGMTLRGIGPLWLGHRRVTQIEGAVKEALDPKNRFPSLDE
ncbi:MAG: FAD-binding protein [Pedosphaera sp.]|nr:FAD-binding protein [Pedosphaera sp.]